MRLIGWQHFRYLDSMGQLFSTAQLAKQAMPGDDLTVLADRGYYKGEDIRACHLAGIKVLAPKPLTSNSKAQGLFDKRDFRYDREQDVYHCPAGEVLSRRHSSVEEGMTIQFYYASAPVCRGCQLR